MLNEIVMMLNKIRKPNPEYTVDEVEKVINELLTNAKSDSGYIDLDINVILNKIESNRRKYKKTKTEEEKEVNGNEVFNDIFDGILKSISSNLDKNKYKEPSLGELDFYNVLKDGINDLKGNKKIPTALSNIFNEVGNGIKQLAQEDTNKENGAVLGKITPVKKVVATPHPQREEKPLSKIEVLEKKFKENSLSVEDLDKSTLEEIVKERKNIIRVCNMLNIQEDIFNHICRLTGVKLKLKEEIITPLKTVQAEPGEFTYYYLNLLNLINNIHEGKMKKRAMINFVKEYTNEALNMGLIESKKQIAIPSKAKLVNETALGISIFDIKQYDFINNYDDFKIEFRDDGLTRIHKKIRN